MVLNAPDGRRQPMSSNAIASACYQFGFDLPMVEEKAAAGCCMRAFLRTSSEKRTGGAAQLKYGRRRWMVSLSPFRRAMPSVQGTKGAARLAGVVCSTYLTNRRRGYRLQGGFQVGRGQIAVLYDAPRRRQTLIFPFCVKIAACLKVLATAVIPRSACFGTNLLARVIFASEADVPLRRSPITTFEAWGAAGCLHHCSKIAL